MENEIRIKGKTITYIVKGIFNLSTYSSVNAKVLLRLKKYSDPSQSAEGVKRK